jgi:hypothetical protein
MVVERARNAEEATEPQIYTDAHRFEEEADSVYLCLSAAAAPSRRRAILSRQSLGGGSRAIFSSSCHMFISQYPPGAIWCYLVLPGATGCRRQSAASANPPHFTVSSRRVVSPPLPRHSTGSVRRRGWRTSSPSSRINHTRFKATVNINTHLNASSQFWFRVPRFSERHGAAMTRRRQAARRRITRSPAAFVTRRKPGHVGAKSLGRADYTCARADSLERA